MEFACLLCGARADGPMPPFVMVAKGGRACGSCGTTLVPGRAADTVMVRIRWQELRLILTLAHAGLALGEFPEAAGVVLHAIASRLSPCRPPLTPPLTGEQLVAELRAQGHEVLLDGGFRWPPEVEQGGSGEVPATEA